MKRNKPVDIVEMVREEETFAPLRAAIAESQRQGIETDSPTRNIHEYLERRSFWAAEAKFWGELARG